MPYAPATPDKSADFIFNGMQSAQDRDLKQQQINLQSQQQMMDSAGSIMDLVNAQTERGTKNAEAADFQKATWEGYKRMLGESAIPPEMNEKFYGGGIGAQRAMNEQLGMLAQQAAPQFQPSVTDLGIPGFSFVNTSKGSGQLVNTNPASGDTADRAANYQIITDTSGNAVRVNKLTGQAEPVVDSSGNPVQPKSSGFDFNSMFGGGAATPPAPAQAQPVAPPAATGYVIGKRYSGMTFLGGDPNDPTSWQK